MIVNTMMFLSGGGGGGFINVDYIRFDGANAIELPFNINADYKVTVTFDPVEYVNAQAVLGNRVNPMYFQLIQYNNLWYTSLGSGETSFTAALTGKHTYVNNYNGGNFFDENEVTSYTPTTLDTPMFIGWRSNGATYFTGKIYYFKIESISTGDVICELVPKRLLVDNYEAYGLHDTVNGKFYTFSTFTGGYDE